MTTGRLHPLRLGVIALFVAVLIPTIASAQNEAPRQRRSSPSTYQVGLSLDFTAQSQSQESRARTAFVQDRVAHQERSAHRQAQRRREQRRAKLRSERRARQQAATPAPVSAPTSSSSPAPSSSSSVNWDAIAACESGGRWDLNNGNGFWGGLQFTPGTWFAYGGGPFSGSGPFPYSRSDQIAVANRVLAGQGLGAWPYCGRYA
jgi:hypothetical protein